MNPYRYRLHPITVREALRFVEHEHRHLPELQGALFAAGVKLAGDLVGVATAGHPARVWMGMGRIVISRCAVKPDLPGVGVHAAPVCTKLYNALCRAAEALGWSEAWTYTLPGEDGRSVKAAGFTSMGWTRSESWDRQERPRQPVNTAAKGRWARGLDRTGRARIAIEHDLLNRKAAA
jgi:hypothetical protein